MCYHFCSLVCKFLLHFSWTTFIPLVKCHSTHGGLFDKGQQRPNIFLLCFTNEILLLTWQFVKRKGFQYATYLYLFWLLILHQLSSLFILPALPFYDWNTNIPAYYSTNLVVNPFYKRPHLSIHHFILLKTKSHVFLWYGYLNESFKNRKLRIVHRWTCMVSIETANVLPISWNTSSQAILWHWAMHLNPPMLRYFV